GIAVAELLGQVEREAGGDLGRAQHRLPVAGESVDCLFGGEQDGLVVAASLRLAAVERGAAADRDEGVLKGAPPLVVDVDVAGGGGGQAELAGKLPKGCVPARVAALVRTLELDVEAVGPECGCRPGGAVRVPRAEPVARAAGEADEPLGALQQGFQRQL